MQKSDFSKLLPKGSVLVFSLLILSIMLVTSLTILSSAVLDRKASLSTGSSTRSFQVADSGVEEVLYQIYKGTGNSTLSILASKIPGAGCDAGKISFPVAGGKAVVGFYQDEKTIYANGCGGADDDWRDKVVKIKSEGTAGSTTRAVEVAVAAENTGNSLSCFLHSDLGPVCCNEETNGNVQCYLRGLGASWTSIGFTHTSWPSTLVSGNLSCGSSAYLVNGQNIFCCKKKTNGDSECAEHSSLVSSWVDFGPIQP